MSDECPERPFRTLFISDVHLGARGSQAERLLDFLRSHDADSIYLVGDIVDGWALQSNWYWPQSHNDFVQKMLRKARKGAKVIYVPGNHDEFLRNYYGTHFGGIDVVENTIHVGVDGRPGTKVIVGDGPALVALARKYPQAVFLGARQGEELAEAYAAAAVFVFPSKIDTFGLVLLEALASGLPVAAFPVTGPRDVIAGAPVGVLNDDLRMACLSALHISAQACLEFAAEHTWEASARAFVENITDVHNADPDGEVLQSVAERPRFVV
jgi:glycogen synthase